MLVSHAATVVALVRGLVGNRELPLRVGCCSITELSRNEKEDWKVIGGWEAKRLADGAHLRDGTSRDWGFEDAEIADGKVTIVMNFVLRVYAERILRLSMIRVKPIPCLRKISPWDPRSQISKFNSLLKCRSFYQTIYARGCLLPGTVHLLPFRLRSSPIL